MKNSNELKGELEEAKEQCNALLAKDELTDEETDQVIALQDKQEALQKDIAEAEKKERVQALKVAAKAAGSGVEIQNNGSSVGTAATINFASNVTASVTDGVATINATGGGGGGGGGGISEGLAIAYAIAL